MQVQVEQRLLPGNLTLLLQRLILAASISMLVVLVGGGLGIYRVYSNHILRDAEEDAVTLSEVLVSGQHDLLFSPGADGRTRLFVAPGTRSFLAHRLREFLHPFRIVEIKIYDPAGKVLFSTQPALVGQLDDDNDRLQQALTGHPDSHLETKGSIRDLADEPRLDVDVVETYVPIYLGKQVAGAFEVYVDVTRYRHEIFTTVASSVLILGGILLAVFGVSILFVKTAARRVATAQQQLHTLATTDALTGTFNRGAILARARAEISGSERRHQQRQDTTLSFILLDIDHFKKVNDTHGHLVGDRVLEEVVQRVRHAARGYDLLGRFGGEEFLLILPDADFVGAVAAAERVRQAVDAEPFVLDHTTLHLTISLGVATSRPGEQNLDEVLNRADAGLYQAKAAGRNRVAWSESPMSS